MATSFSPSQAELALVSQIFLQADPQKLGIITGDVAVRVFGGAKLPPTVLGAIWSIADEENHGWLSKKGVAIAVRLMGWAQKGETVTQALVNKPGPLPSIEGVSAVTQHNTGMSLPRSPPPSLPRLTAQDKAKFQRLFAGCGPVNGLLSGEKARDVFVKSKLPVEKLLQIWNLADTQDRGVLDSTDFAIGMYLIQASMSGQLSFIPTSLPPGLYEQAGGNPQVTIPSHATGTSGSFSPTLGSVFPQTRSAIQQQYTGQSHSLQLTYTGTSPKPGTSPRQPTRPAPSAFSSSGAFAPQGNGHAQQWDVTAAKKASSDHFFDSLDSQKKGYIEGDVAVPFMLESKLPGEDLAQVWDLADINNDGRLTRDGFAVAMHLIQGKLDGKDIPTALPASLIPPSMRTNGASPFSPPAQQEQQDLLGDETPPQSATFPQQTGNVQQAQMTGAQQQQTSFVAPSPPRSQPSANYDPFGSSPPQRNLLDNDDDPGSTAAPLYDQSAEIGNVQNQLNSTNRSVETTKVTRASVEQTLANQASQLSALQTQLSSAKAAYETETTLLSTLRERLSAQTADIQKTKEDLIRAESDLSAVRVEKAEVEGSFLRDKEDARELHRKMVEAGQQTETMKLEVEKAKKEAKQQKGLLAIARKQLSTKEMERARAEKELVDANDEAAEAARETEEAEAELAKISISPPPNILQWAGSAGGDSLNFAASYALPVTPDMSTPAAMSPNVTGKSNNPFERLAKSGHSTPRSQSPFLPANAPLPPPPTADAPLVVSSNVPFEFSEVFAEAPVAPQQDLTINLADVEASVSKEIPAEILIPPLSVTPVPHSPAANSENEQFATPPDTAAGPSRITSPLQIPDQNTSTMFPALDSQLSPPESTLPGHFPLSPEYHERGGETDLGSQPMELDVSDSDSDSDDDEVPLSELKAKVPDDNAAPTTNGTAAVSASDAPPTIPFDDAFGQLMDTSAFTSASQERNLTPQARDAFGAPVTQTSSSFTTSTQEHSAHESTVAGVNAFDEAMGKIPSGSASQAPQLTFETAFEDNFDFALATAPPIDMNGKTSASTTTRQTNGFDSIFASSINKGIPAAPAGDSQRLPSFDDTFASTISAPASQAAVNPSVEADHGISFDEAFSGFDLSQSLKPDSPFGSLPSRTSAILPRPIDANSRPFSTASPPASPGSASSPVRVSSMGLASPPARQWSPPPRISSPKQRTSTSSSGKESQEKPKDPPPRHSKLSIRLPFGRKKKHDVLPPPPPPAQFLSPPIEEPSRTMTPAVDDDAEPVKQLCGMGFSRSQAVHALETQGYDFQRALNSLLTASES